MVWIAGGQFTMGSDHAYQEEAPARKVRVDGFWIDKHEVTNAEFAEFVKETGYKTVAERNINKKAFPEADPSLLQAGSAVFSPPKKITSTKNYFQWWKFVPGANWKHPQGPESSIKGRENHPVVHIAFEDAQAFATWAKKELPTEAQWEFAAAGQVIENNQANTWQGEFPLKNSKIDGFKGAAPVKSYTPNKFGLYDMLGNVWEWTKTSSNSSQDLIKVIKGGSFLCAPNYCMRYRPSARFSQDAGLGTNHIGFRTVLNVSKR